MIIRTSFITETKPILEAAGNKRNVRY